LSNYLNNYDNTATIVAENEPLLNTVTITTSNNTFYLKPNIGIKGLYDTIGTNKITINVPPGTYNPYTINSAVLRQLQNNPLTANSYIQMQYDAPGNEYSYIRFNILRTYTAQDYTVEFFDEANAQLERYYSTNSTTGSVFKITTWDVTLGWQMGYRTSQSYNLSPTANTSNSINEIQNVSENSYTYDATTNIITLSSDTPANIFLYNNFFIKLIDFTNNRLNDGLVSVTTTPKDVQLPNYTSKATQRVDPLNNTIVSFRNLQNQSYGLTQNQLYASMQVVQNKQNQQLYTRTPYMKDMFAVIPMKLAGLQPGQTFAEYGGTLQDNNRIYFGPVDIATIEVQLVNDHGDVVDLSGLNWTFSIVCEYLYSISRD
jgi:hypothetical protein